MYCTSKNVQVAQAVSYDSKGWRWRKLLVIVTLSAALTPGMKALLDKHEYTNRIEFLSSDSLRKSCTSGGTDWA
jgi:hypothetical protein